MADTTKKSKQTLPVYECRKVSSPPVIDGILNDEAWSIAEPVPLTLAETGKPASRTTLASMCWDNENLYISFECEDPEIWATLENHDDPIYDQDVVEVFLDPDGDLTTYFELEWSPKNVVFDASFDAEHGRPLGSEAARAWTCVGMKSAVAVDGLLGGSDKDRGWTVEIAIPFASLGRQTPKVGEEWRGNLYRIDYRPEPAEFQAWSSTVVLSFHETLRFGTILFTE